MKLKKTKKKKAFRYSIFAELIKGGEIVKKMAFSPLARSKGRAIECVMLLAARRGYEGIKIRG